MAKTSHGRKTAEDIGWLCTRKVYLCTRRGRAPIHATPQRPHKRSVQCPTEASGVPSLSLEERVPADEATALRIPALTATQNQPGRATRLNQPRSRGLLHELPRSGGLLHELGPLRARSNRLRCSALLLLLMRDTRRVCQCTLNFLSGFFNAPPIASRGRGVRNQLRGIVLLEKTLRCIVCVTRCDIRRMHCRHHRWR